MERKEEGCYGITGQGQFNRAELGGHVVTRPALLSAAY